MYNLYIYSIIYEMRGKESPTGIIADYIPPRPPPRIN